jgi:argonaute-like protein implicated in RNA metabolism and viral defense
MGFQKLFRIPFSVERELPLPREDEKEVQRAVQDLARQGDVDLALVIVTSQNEVAYRTVKQLLLGIGIPNQVVTIRKLRDEQQVPWVLENVALACYAKIGGTPWVVASNDNRRELVIGISRAQDRTKKVVVGFVTLFTHDGDFLLLHSLAPVLKWELEKYVNGLTKLIIDAYDEYCKIKEEEPDAIILHLCKRPGRYREVEAIEQALQQINASVPYALIHLNDDSSYRLFDASHNTCIPQAGLKVELSRRNALLLLDGRTGNKRSRRGVPRVLDISMDKRSTMPVDEFPRLVRQVYNFARVNWRGFNASAVPVTLNYSYLITRLIVEIGADKWNQAISTCKLSDKAWFL